MSFDRDQFKSLAMIGAVVAICTAGLAIIWLASDFSLAAKTMLSGVILLIYPAVLWVDRLFKRRAETGMNDTDEVITRPKNERAFPELERAAAVAVNWLRERLGASAGTDWAYSRPWYLVAGTPAGGKTSLLDVSTLHFHTLPGENRLFHGLTSACDWRVSDDAVLLDTAGRYQTDGQHDVEEWQGLIQLLKSYRKDRPLDGLLLVVNIADVINAESSQLEQRAKILRARLDDVIAIAGHTFPVYLIFTNIDEMPGFTEFFPSATLKECEEIWGVTFPVNEATQARDRLEVELDTLHQQLLRRRLARLGERKEKEGAAEQLSIFNFPIQFRRHHSKLALLMGAIFRPNPYNKLQPLLRGFYFTASAPQQRDRGVITTISSENATLRNGFFTAQLFRQVILGDRHLAASLQTGLSRRYLLQQMLAGATAALLLFGTISVVLSFRNNRELIAEGEQYATALKTAYLAHQSEPVISQDELTALEKARAFLEDNEKGRGLFYRFGLYSGEAVGKPLRDQYFEVLSQRFFIPVARGIEKTLSDFADSPKTVCPGGNSPEAIKCYGRYYRLLRIYQMFGTSEQVNSDLLTTQLLEYRKKSGSSPELAAWPGEQLAFYAKRAMELQTPHWKTNSDLTGRAMEFLKNNYPVSNRYFEAVIAKADEEFTEKFAGVFTSSDWVTSDSSTVPAAFTLNGYKQLRSRLERPDDDLIKKEGLATNGEQVNGNEVKALYANEYSNQWETFLGSVRVKPFKDSDAAQKAFGELSQDASPLVRLLNKVAEQTGQGTQAERSWWQLWGGDPLLPPEEVKKKFEPLKAFVSKDGNSGLSQVIGELKALQSNMNKVRPLTFESIRAALSEAKTKINNNIASLDKGATQPAASLLKKPCEEVEALLQGDEVTRLKRGWEGLVSSINNVKSQYPFNRNSQADASLEEIKRLFGPGGEVQTTLRKGFEKHLDFDPTTRQWQYKPNPVFSDQRVVSYLNSIVQIQDALFPNLSPELKFSYTLTVKSLPTGVTARLNGQDSAQNPVIARTWPQEPISIVVTLSNTQVDTSNASGTWGIFRLADRFGTKGVNGYNVNIGSVPVTLQYTSNVDPFNRQLFSQLVNIPPLQ